MAGSAFKKVLFTALCWIWCSAPCSAQAAKELSAKIAACRAAAGFTAAGYFVEAPGRDAEKICKDAVNSHPQDSAATAYLARVRYVAGQFRESLDLLRRGEAAGEPITLTLIGMAYNDGDGVEEDLSKALDLWERAAQLGQANAQYLLALHHLGRTPRSADLAEALPMLKKAVTAGLPSAINLHGWLVMRGVGAETQSQDAAVALYEKAADQKDPDAMYNWSVLNLERHPARAFQYLKEASRHGHTEATVLLGELAWRGRLTRRDDEQALKLLRSVTSQNLRAKWIVGTMALQGRAPPITQQAGRQLLIEVARTQDRQLRTRSRDLPWDPGQEPSPVQEIIKLLGIAGDEAGLARGRAMATLSAQETLSGLPVEAQLEVLGDSLSAGNADQVVRGGELMALTLGIKGLKPTLDAGALVTLGASKRTTANLTGLPVLSSEEGGVERFNRWWADDRASSKALAVDMLQRLDARTAESLLPPVLGESDPRIRRALLVVTWSAPIRGTESFILAHLSDPDPLLREYAVRAAAKANLPLTAEQLDLLSADSSPKVREALLRYSADASWRMSEEFILAALRSKDSELRAAALRAVSVNPTRAVRAQILGMVELPGSAISSSAIKNIRFGDEVLGPVQALSEAQLDGRLPASLEAIELAVERTDPEQIAAPLRLMLAHPSALERKRALWILDRNGGRQFDDLAAHLALNDNEAVVRRMAIGVLLGSQEPRMAQVFAQATSDPDATVRRRAMEGVAKDSWLSQRHAIVLSTDPDRWVRYRAAASLRPEDSPQSRAALQQLIRDPDEEVRNMAGESLGQPPNGTDQDLQTRLGDMGTEAKLSLLCQLKYSAQAVATIPTLIEIASDWTLSEKIRSRALYCAESPAQRGLSDPQIERLAALMRDPTSAVFVPGTLRVLQKSDSPAAARIIWSQFMTRGATCDAFGTADIPQVEKAVAASPYLAHPNVWVRRRALECFDAKNNPLTKLMNAWIKQSNLPETLPIETLLSFRKADAAPALAAALRTAERRSDRARLQATLWLTGTNEAYESALAYRGDLWEETYFSDAWIRAIASRPTETGFESLLLEFSRHHSSWELRDALIEISASVPNIPLDPARLAPLADNFGWWSSFRRYGSSNRNFSPLAFLTICLASSHPSSSTRDLNYLGSENIRVLPSQHAALRRVTAQCLEYWQQRGALPSGAVIGWAVRLFLNAGLIDDANALPAGADADPYAQAAFLVSMAEARIRKGKIDQGSSLLKAYETQWASRLNKDDKVDQFTLRVLLLRGMIASAMNDTEKAYYYLRSASDRAGRTATGITAFGLSLKYEKRDVLTKARWKTDEDTLLDESGPLVQGAVREILEYLVEREIQKGNPGQSLIEADRLAAFHDAQIRPEPATMVDGEKAFAIRQLRELQGRVARLSAGGEMLQARSEELGLARQQLMGWLTEMRIRYPAMTALLRPGTVDLLQVRRVLGDSGALVQYIVLSQRSYVWVVTKEREYLLVSPYRSSDIRKWIGQARSFWNGSFDEAAVVEESIAGLSKALIEPVREVAGNARHWIVVPHADLHSLPFGALYWGNTKDPLIVHRTISYAASAASVATQTMERRSSVTRMLAIGGPTSYGGFSELPAAAEEASNVAKSFEPNSDLFTGAEARKTLLSATPLRYTDLHLAVHGQLRDAYQSRLVFADGFLEVKDIWALSLLNSPRVVLSACESGLGRAVTGNDVLSLATGFLAAGAQSVVSTLWRVPDKETATLMSSFYRASQSAPNAAEAVASMQRDAIKAGLPPRVWAAFVVHGR